MVEQYAVLMELILQCGPGSGIHAAGDFSSKAAI